MLERAIKPMDIGDNRRRYGEVPGAEGAPLSFPHYMYSAITEASCL